MGIGGGGGYGGKGGDGVLGDFRFDGGIIYGSSELFCEFGSGGGNFGFGSFIVGGGLIG